MNVWVIAETSALATELVSGAKKITKDAAQITAFVGGDEAAGKHVAACGASKVTVMPLLAQAMWEDYTPALVEKAKAEAPAIILVGATKRGKDMAAQMAVLLDAPCVSDCKSMSLEGDTKTNARMIYGGMALKTMTTTAPTVIAVVAAKSFEPLEEGASSGTVDTMPAPAAGQVVVTGRTAKVAGGVNLADAAKVVGIGRGFVEQSEVPLAENLAKAMGAEMACSRPIAEFFKWMPEEAYLGISGQIIKPQVYIAAGISGQVQHLSGVRDAKIIVSVNKDENAPMNAMSDYFIVGDIKEVLPELTKAFSA
ncbi:MAG: electron transfer flavoprotein subunit alpha/FixB family protein [Bilophila sp.]